LGKAGIVARGRCGQEHSKARRRGLGRAGTRIEARLQRFVQGGGSDAVDQPPLRLAQAADVAKSKLSRQRLGCRAFGHMEPHRFAQRLCEQGFGPRSSEQPHQIRHADAHAIGLPGAHVDRGKKALGDLLACAIQLVDQRTCVVDRQQLQLALAGSARAGEALEGGQRLLRGGRVSHKQLGEQPQAERRHILGLLLRPGGGLGAQRGPGFRRGQGREQRKRADR
jgi:hypothetical protein